MVAVPKLLKLNSRESASDDPDKYWKYLIVLAAFLVHVITDGITYAFGLQLTHIEQTFHSSKGASNAIISVLIGLTLGAGPLTSALVDNFGCQKVVFAGSILAAIGAIISCFATGTTFLIITVGLIMGTGFSMMFSPSVIIVNLYFTKQRALAVGFVVCGAGIGTFMFAPLNTILAEQYTWRGAFIIYAAIIIHGCALGAILRYPISMQREAKKVIMIEDLDISADMENGVVQVGKTRETSISIPLPVILPVTSFKSENLANKRMSRSADILNNPKGALLGSHQVIPARPRCFSVMNQDELAPDENAQIYFDNMRSVPRGSQLRIHPLARKDIYYSRNVRDLELPMLTRRALVRNAVSQSVMPASVLATSGPKFSDENDPVPHPKQMELDELSEIDADDQVVAKDVQFMENFKMRMRAMLDLSLLKDPVYLLIAISNLMTNLGYDLPRIILTEHVEGFGVEENRAAFLLSIWGITNTIGRALVGFMCDRKPFNRHRLAVYNGFLIFCGLVNIVSWWATTYWEFAVYSAFYGFFLSCYISLTSVILVDLLGVDRLTNAFGLLLFFQGLGAVLGPIIGGVIQDATNENRWAFEFAGIMLFLSGAILMPILFVNRCVKKSGSYNNAATASAQDDSDNNQLRADAHKSNKNGSALS